MMEEICVTNNNPCNDSGITIANFLAGKNVFITGGSGFLGTVLIERLLSATPDIGNIYVLIRAKRGHTPENRIERLLSKTVSFFEISLISHKRPSSSYFLRGKEED